MTLDHLRQRYLAITGYQPPKDGGLTELRAACRCAMENDMVDDYDNARLRSLCHDIDRELP